VEDFGDPTFALPRSYRGGCFATAMGRFVATIATTVVTVATATIVATETTATAVVHG